MATGQLKIGAMAAHSMVLKQMEKYDCNERSSTETNGNWERRNGGEK